MNIVVLNDFPEEIVGYLTRSTPQASFRFYSPDQMGTIPADIMAAADVLYTSGPLPDRSSVPHLKWVQAHSAGVDHFLNHPLFSGSGAGKGNSIRLTTASGVHAINIAEYILMMMLALAHRLPLAFQSMNRVEWGDRSLFMPRELYGATAGIVGYGAIGRQTARLCKGAGMRVLAMRRSTATSADDVAIYPPERLHEFLSECDYVALTLPLTRMSHRLIDASAITAMKHSAYLINISRGDIVDEAAMITALQTGQLAGAALDVFAREPLPLDSPFWHMDNVIMTPHIAGITPNYARRAAELFVDNLHRYLAGNPLVNNVDFARGY